MRGWTSACGISGSVHGRARSNHVRRPRCGISAGRCQAGQAESGSWGRYRVALSKPPEHRDTASSGFVPRLRLRDITSERFSGVKMSAIGGEDRAIFDPRKWMGENGHFCL